MPTALVAFVRNMPLKGKISFHKDTGRVCLPVGGSRYLPPAPQADGFSFGLSPAPQAEGFSSGLSPAPHAEGLSDVPQEEVQTEAVPMVFHSCRFESAIVFSSINVLGCRYPAYILGESSFVGKQALIYYRVTFLYPLASRCALHYDSSTAFHFVPQEGAAAC